MNKEALKKLMSRFRMIAIAEGVSFLILVGIAMPLKYFFHYPEAVKVFGWVHGALFVTFIYFAFQVMTDFNKKAGWFAGAFAAAILPCGTFVLDRQLKKDMIAI